MDIFASFDVIIAILYIVLYSILGLPINLYFEKSHPITLLYILVLPLLLGFNLSDAIFK